MSNEPTNIKAGDKVRVVKLNHLQLNLPIFRGDFGTVEEANLNKLNHFRDLIRVRFDFAKPEIAFFYPYQLEVMEAVA